MQWWMLWHRQRRETTRSAQPLEVNIKNDCFRLCLRVVRLLNRKGMLYDPQEVNLMVSEHNDGRFEAPEICAGSCSWRRLYWA